MEEQQNPQYPEYEKLEELSSRGAVNEDEYEIIYNEIVWEKQTADRIIPPRSSRRKEKIPDRSPFTQYPEFNGEISFAEVIPILFSIISVVFIALLYLEIGRGDEFLTYLIISIAGLTALTALIFSVKSLLSVRKRFTIFSAMLAFALTAGSVIVFITIMREPGSIFFQAPITQSNAENMAEPQPRNDQYQRSMNTPVNPLPNEPASISADTAKIRTAVSNENANRETAKPVQHDTTHVTTAPEQKGHFVIVLLSGSKQEDAEYQAAAIKTKYNLEAKIMSGFIPDRGNIYRVCIGNYSTKEKAKLSLEEVKIRTGINDAWVLELSK